jgi:MFS family permease
MNSSKTDSPSRFGLSRPVWLLGWVSFFTDMASEMVYPLLPLFLTQVLGAGAMSLGVIEGAAEAANSALKIVSGWLADRWQSPKKLVLLGYGIASGVRPLIGFATAWPQVLAIRFSDRLGKGIRGAPRDAMLADFAAADARGRVYGFHRAMDHAGAVTGPLLATAFLYFYPGNYRTLFLLTIVPGIIVILFILKVPDRGQTGVRLGSDRGQTGVRPGSERGQTGVRPGSDWGQTPSQKLPSPSEGAAPRRDGPARRPWRLGNRFYGAMIVILLFSLGNASDAFLLLRLSDLGVTSLWIPLLWSALHVVKVASSLVGGALSDRFGRRGLIALGWLWYALVYAGFGYFDTKGTVIAIFLAYGLFFGLTEGNEKAWVADMAPAHARGTAFGIYNAALGIGTLAASLIFGAIWTRISPHAAFLTGAGLAVVASALLFTMFAASKDPAA